MKLARNIISIFLLSITSLGTVYAQDAIEEEVEKKDLTNGTLAEQFDYVIENSNRYQIYKVIKKEWMYTLKSHVKDTLKSFQDEILGLNGEILTKSKKIEELENGLTAVESNLTEVSSEKDAIVFMGNQISKEKYKTMMWSIVGVLTALFLFFFFKFRSSNSITRSIKSDLSNLQDEFTLHKKNALAKEQELARKLQDELNKVNK